ncbi:hypothetical protein C8F04DRAFT_1261142 [Mycena alexandri]|uniref:F-box domain-containing protein n=1 Tax=Mycena alexandri TaxID=1745969 RepID=A0AAD6SSM5_9AGAR|nr:hypothetical protein C8F04DRAFT_1261142 [Mycena alexandri]
MNFSLAAVSNGMIMDRLRSNDAPVFSEAQQIKEILESVVQLPGLLAQSPDGQPEPEALRKLISNLSSLIAPIRRLPLELLEIIFVNAIGIADLALHSGTHRRVPAVCHHWRSVALSTPEFWSTFAVSLEAQGGTVLPTLRLHIARSRQRLLRIHILYDNPLFLSKEINGEALAELLKHTEQWGHISIPHGLDVSHFALTRGRLLSLQSFAYEGKWLQAPLALQAFMMAPNLYTVDLALSNLDDYTDTRMENIVPCQGHLTRLTLHHFQRWNASLGHFIQQFCGSLCQLILHDIKIRTRDLLAALRILPALESLSIGRMSALAVNDVLFDAIESEKIVPLLKEFYLGGRNLGSTGSILSMLESRDRRSRLSKICLVFEMRAVWPTQRSRLKSLGFLDWSKYFRRVAGGFARIDGGQARWQNREFDNEYFPPLPPSCRVFIEI